MNRLQTKFNEEILTTSNLEEMKGKYIAKRLLRTWKEDFTDEDTGEVVSIDRNEVLFDKGAFLSPDNLSQINFWLQSNDIKEVTVSNQKRESTLIFGSASVWQVTAVLNGKTKSNLYLYANSVEMAMQISSDFLEQQYTGFFNFSCIRELDYFTLLSTSENEVAKSEKEYHFYKIDVDIIDLEDHTNYIKTFFLKASDAEDAKAKIFIHLTEFRKNNDLPNPFELKIVAAKTINCDNVIDYGFSEEYFNKQNE